jgi:uncharacterized protein involved in exopolysaccharide biosynthesis
MNQNKLTAQDYIEVILQRKWFLIFIFFAGTITSIGYSHSRPLVYRSSTLILVEPQQIPTAYVNPTVTSTVQERLNTISQQILSRTNLEKIILQLELYNTKWNENSLFSVIRQKINTLIDLSTEKVLIYFNINSSGESLPIEDLVEQMRKDVEINVVGRGNAFSVSYVAKDPVTAMRVPIPLHLFLSKKT